MKTVDKIIMMNTDSIIPYSKNPRKNDKTVELLCKIIPKVGFNVPIVIDKDNVIVKGHARWLAAKQLNMKEVPCVISDADPEAIKADRISDNKIIEFSKWLDEELAHEVDMLDIDLDLEEFGLPSIDIPSFDFDFNDDQSFEDENIEQQEIDEEERRKRFFALLEQQSTAPKVQITTESELNFAKDKQANTHIPVDYYQVTCENCGHAIFVRAGRGIIEL